MKYSSYLMSLFVLLTIWSKPVFSKQIIGSLPTNEEIQENFLEKQLEPEENDATEEITTENESDTDSSPTDLLNDSTTDSDNNDKVEDEDTDNTEVDNEQTTDDENNPASFYNLDFNFQTLLTFTDAESGSSLMEVIYHTSFKIDVAASNTPKKQKAFLSIVPEVVGNIAINELFQCYTEIEIDETSAATIETRLKTINATEDSDETTDLLLKINFDEIPENWHTTCVAAEDKLNTLGEPQFYNQDVLNQIFPALKKILLQDIELNSRETMTLEVEPYTIDESATLKITIDVTGSGTLTIEKTDQIFEETELE